MPLKLMTTELRNRRQSRTALFGPPNSFKTTSVLQTACYPLVIISPPGEEGFCTIPTNVPGLTALVWEQDPTAPQTYSSIKSEVEGAAYKALAGEYGVIRTLCIDGFHQLYKVYLNLTTDGALSRGEDFEARLYTGAHEMANDFLKRITQSPVEHVIVTTWNEREADRPKRPGDRAADIDSHEYPALPGKMAKNIVGMFSVLAFSRVTKKKLPDGRMVGEWLLRPDQDVWGASVKMDPRLVARLPQTCPQNFRELYRIIGAAQGDVEKADTQVDVSVAGV